MAAGPREGEVEPPKAPGGFWNWAKEPVKYAFEGFRAAIRGAPPGLKAGMLVSFLFAILGPLYLVILQGIGLVIFGVFLFAFAALFVFSYARLPRPKVANVSYPLQRALRPLLEDARVAVRDRLMRANSAVKDDDVRANIFLPYRVGRGKRGIRLRIPATLCIKMGDPAERGIEFEPGLGATGRAFRFGEPVYAFRNPKEVRGWDKKYQISAEQAKLIHPDLKWIISLPLRDKDKRVVGVANVDGLRHGFAYDEIVGCADGASAFVEVMSELLC